MKTERNPILKSSFLILLCLCSNWGLLSAQFSFPFSEIEYISSEDGLSHGEVTCMIQDQKGFIWIGTRGGLNRYDGNEFKLFQNEIGNPNSLINNSIEVLYEDSRGLIWIGTKSGGLSCYDPKQDQFVHYQHDPNDPNTITGNRIFTIAESNLGEIWVGDDWNSGLTIINVEARSCQRVDMAIGIRRIYSAADGEMWITCRDGLAKLSNKGDILAIYQSPIRTGFFRDIIQDRVTKKFYLGTWSDGLFEFDPEHLCFNQYKYEDKEKGLSVNNFYSLYQDSNAQIWVGSWNGRLRQFDPLTGELHFYDLASERAPGAPELYKDVLCIMEDRSNALWFGTNGGGVCRVDKRIQQFSLPSITSTASNLPKEPIWSIFKDQEEVLWVGFRGNKNLYYSKNGQRFSSLEIKGLRESQNNAIKNGVIKIYQSQDGTIYAATKKNLYEIIENKASYSAKPIRVKLENQEQKIRVMHMHALIQATDGTFYFGQQLDGLSRSLTKGEMSQRIFENYTPTRDSSLQSFRITDILEDETGRIWIGTYKGLHLYRPTSDDFLFFTKQQDNIHSLSSDIIICMHEDRKGNLWLGTPNGLNLVVPAIDQQFSFQCFQESDGLPNNYIHGIEEDNNGFLWISTNKGISKFDPEQRIFLNYDVNDGLPSNSFMENASFKDEDGILYFGSINGLTVFHPDSIREQKSNPELVLTSFKIFNQEIKAGREFDKRIILDQAIEYESSITLGSEVNVFSIDYTALNFLPPSGNAYCYKMVGLEEEWNFVGTHRSVTYNNLKPGVYTFMVKTTNSKGLPKGKAAQLKIRILPPIYATIPAYILYTILFIGLLLLYSYFINRQNQLQNSLEITRLEQLQEIELAQLKTRFFTNITHELRTPLTLIAGPVEEILETEKLSGRLKDYMLTAHHHTQRLLGLVNQLLDFRKAESGQMVLQAAEGNIVKFSNEVFLSFREMAVKKTINFQFNFNRYNIPVCYDRDKMEIVLCNLLSNALKYTPEKGTVALSIEYIPPSDEYENDKPGTGYCDITVKDNGKGMPAESVEKIFDRFYQIANSTSFKLVGTGIGLALVKNIVDLHKGEILVESQEGFGSTFRIRIPLGQMHLDENQLITNFRNSEHHSHYQLQGATRILNSWVEKPLYEEKEAFEEPKELLIVEDNLEIAAFIQKIFESEYKIFLAENGKEGFIIAKERLPDLIISDVMMPVMDGIVFCENLKKEEKTAHIPIILLTARTSTVYKVEGFESGADAYVTKPFQPAVLKAQVNSLLIARQKLKKYFSKKITLQPTAVEITSLDEQFLKKIMQLVEDNLTNDELSRNYLAKAVNMSPSSLYRKIKALTGKTTNAFIRAIRLKRAAQLMQHSQYNISEIAYQVGFNDLKYFRSCFKEQFGVNPSQYVENQGSVTDAE